MIPDIKLRDYYLQFIYNAKADIIKYKENLNLFDMPKSLKDAKIKDIYTDDASRTEAIKYVINFLKN